MTPDMAIGCYSGFVLGITLTTILTLIYLFKGEINRK